MAYLKQLQGSNTSLSEKIMMIWEKIPNGTCGMNWLKTVQTEVVAVVGAATAVLAGLGAWIKETEASEMVIAL